MTVVLTTSTLPNHTSYRTDQIVHQGSAEHSEQKAIDSGLDYNFGFRDTKHSPTPWEVVRDSALATLVQRYVSYLEEPGCRSIFTEIISSCFKKIDRDTNQTVGDAEINSLVMAEHVNPFLARSTPLLFYYLRRLSSLNDEPDNKEEGQEGLTNGDLSRLIAIESKILMVAATITGFEKLGAAANDYITAQEIENLGVAQHQLVKTQSPKRWLALCRVFDDFKSALPVLGSQRQVAGEWVECLDRELIQSIVSKNISSSETGLLEELEQSWLATESMTEHAAVPLYSKRTGEIDLNSVRQLFPDCGLQASIISLAAFRPEYIKSLIREDSGSIYVKFPGQNEVKLAGVTGVEAALNPRVREFGSWSLVLTKAFALVLSTQHPGFPVASDLSFVSPIDHCSPRNAFSLLAGVKTDETDLSQLTIEQLDSILTRSYEERSPVVLSIDGPRMAPGPRRSLPFFDAESAFFLQLHDTHVYGVIGYDPKEKIVRFLESNRRLEPSPALQANSMEAGIVDGFFSMKLSYVHKIFSSISYWR